MLDDDVGYFDPQVVSLANDLKEISKRQWEYSNVAPQDYSSTPGKETWKVNLTLARPIPYDSIKLSADLYLPEKYEKALQVHQALIKRESKLSQSPKFLINAYRFFPRIRLINFSDSNNYQETISKFEILVPVPAVKKRSSIHQKEYGLDKHFLENTGDGIFNHDNSFSSFGYVAVKFTLDEASRKEAEKGKMTIDCILYSLHDFSFSSPNNIIIPLVPDEKRRLDMPLFDMKFYSRI
jgi:hypothetical protein